jgi:hypothetical protein
MNSMYWALAQAAEDYPTSDGGGAIAALFGGVFFLIWLVVVVVIVAGLWKVFEKAGEPGWAAIVPIYNLIVLVKISGKEMWWVILFFLPCANFVAAVMISLEIAKKFGQSTGYGIGLALLPFIFYPMLGFGSAQYNRNA